MVNSWETPPAGDRVRTGAGAPKWLRRFVGFVSLVLLHAGGVALRADDPLANAFRQPPPEARPWVYWFVMDGNLTREGITADLEAMQRAGLGGAIMMEVDAGIPRGPVEFMSDPWRALFKHAVNEAERLDLQIALNVGPGWTGSGGPWIPPGQSMQHLVAAATNVVGPAHFDAVLPRAQPRKPFFGEGALPPALEKARKEFYRDVAVLAFPTPPEPARIPDIDEKAFYVRAPYSSQPGVKPFLPAPAEFPKLPADACVAAKDITDLSARLAADGRLDWDVPAGNWTILRFGRTSTGQNTRPAPLPGLGLESDKFDPAALDAHFEAFVGSLLKTVGPHQKAGAGWTMLHLDSWEMSSQNWTADFRAAFQRRRGYDPLPYLPTMTGRVVGSREPSERFLWDLRQTAQELIVENHARHLKALGRRHGFGLSIEPYDMNPCADLTLGGVADVPMCEFWAKGYGFDTEYSCFEAVSIAHTLGRPVVAAESFTSGDSERWQLYPGALKAQGDWAFCTGINRIVFHRYQHQPWLNRWPGMTMGPYGVHWERTQTWWDLVPAYHEYLTRCQYLLRRGLPVADICYLLPEGAPQVFRPPASATTGNPPDHRGYNFDGCAPEVLRGQVSVQDGQLRFADGMTYRLLVLPSFDTMTPPLLKAISDLVHAGATVVGPPPRRSPSLADYPRGDAEVQRLARGLWGDGEPPGVLTERRVGQGRVVWGGDVVAGADTQTAAPSPLADAKWIWYSEGQPAASAPVGARSFRRGFTLATNRVVASARFAATADNAFTLWVNGHQAGGGDNFHQTYGLDVTQWLAPGTNRLVIVAENGGEQPNPAGLIGSLKVEFRDGGTLVLPTDREWQGAKASARPDPTDNLARADWSPAQELGPFEMPPWNPGSEAAPPPEVYPPYDVVKELLAKMNVVPDFESDIPLRYLHRRDGDADLYFVANPAAAPVRARAVFRVTGRQPELWDAVTGETRALPDFTPEASRTAVPLDFAPQQSFFILFRQSGAPSRPAHHNFPDSAMLAEVGGPWRVQFQKDRGAPDELVFGQLLDWSKHPDAGVRHFAGLATYRTTFEVAAESKARPPGSRVFLDLGVVKVMAGVRLNGRDLGTAWTAPFRVDATAALQSGTNTLEIRVANLWPNRLIGDAALPPDQRVAWTTWNPFAPDTPLFASGLLGPVRLLTQE